MRMRQAGALRMLHCPADDACEFVCDVSAAVQRIKTLKSLPKTQITQEKIPLAPLAFWSQRGDSGGLLTNARLTPRSCSSPTGVIRAATRNLRGICPKKKFFTRNSGRVLSTDHRCTSGKLRLLSAEGRVRLLPKLLGMN
jgi:hypothetical protein